MTKPFELKQLRAVVFTTLDYLNPGSLALEKGDFGVESSEQDEKRLTAVRQAGVSAICDKPFDPSHIKNLIE